MDFLDLCVRFSDLFLDVKMNHVRGAVSIRNMAQGSDPSSIGKYEKDVLEDMYVILNLMLRCR